MSKVFYLSLIFLFFSVVCFAQNLVPNPSFEEYDTCPDFNDQVNRAIGWSSYNSTPEYLNSCAPSGNNVDVPINIFGFQEAATGEAYCALAISYTQNPYGLREAIGTQLSSNLIIGEKYLVSIKFCLADNINPTRTACNNLGVKFSTVQYSKLNPIPIDNISQVYSDSIISDTVRWTAVSGSFIADSQYRFISIGNFFDNAHTDTINLMSEFPGVAYYYVDDVSVIKDTTTSQNELNNSSC